MEISGRSYDGALRPLRRALVELFDEAQIRVAETRASRRGRWQFRDLPDGRYTARVTHQGRVQLLRRV